MRETRDRKMRVRERGDCVIASAIEFVYVREYARNETKKRGKLYMRE